MWLHTWRTEPRPAHAPANTWMLLPRWSGTATLLAALCAVAVAVLATRGQPQTAAAPAARAHGVHAPTSVWLGPAATALPTVDSSNSARGPAQLNKPVPSSPAAVSLLASDGIPTTALEAYRRAARRSVASDPRCHLPWPLLAAIGRVESDHGRFATAVLRSDGTSTTKIIGIPLNGVGTALIRDTDHGSLDGDSVFDRAVGPMQFIPSTWANYAVDGNGDHRADPFNIYDAAAAAAHYLCLAGGDLATSAGQTRAVLAYNHSSAYLDAVLRLEYTYAAGVRGLRVPAPPTVAPPKALPKMPPVNPGPPPALRPPRKSKPVKPPHPPSTRAGEPGSPTSSAPGDPTPPTCATPTADPTVTATTSAASDAPAPSTSVSGDTPVVDAPTATDSAGSGGRTGSDVGCGTDTTPP
jgi:membrane-bound lytic murein transglycosylase B